MFPRNGGGCHSNNNNNRRQKETKKFVNLTKLNDVLNTVNLNNKTAISDFTHKANNF